ncbi:MAG: STAS domain-containing protein [Rhodoferax sp.]|nr:STAS domain-containing protein [Rhodoferax sp.]
MSIEFEDVSDSFRKIKLTGRLDIPGTDAISIKFASLATTQGKRVLVDLTGITFLASVGIRELITNAKALQQRQGKMVIFVGENASIAKTLDTTGIDVLIPVFANATEADQAAQAQ